MHGKKVINNSVISILYKIVMLIIGFVTRKIFIVYIGEELLGLNSLYTNLLDLLNLADLGIGVAVQYQLYEPLVKKDYEKLSRIMSAAKKIYNTIGCIIAVAGVVLSFFVQFLIKETSYPLWFVQVAFLISVFGVASGYFFVHKKLFFYANEEFALVNIVDLCSKIITVVISLIMTVIFKNYFIYLFINALYGVCSNFIVNIYYNKRYGKLIQKVKEYKNEVKGITSNLKNVIPIKLSNYVYNSTDNVIISKVLGLTTVAMYSNYMVIINALMGIEYLFGNILTSTIGKIIKEDRSKKDVYKVYLTFQYAQYWFTSVCFCGLVVLLNLVITIWLGNEFLISKWCYIVLVVEFFIHSMYQPAYVMYGASGKFKEDKYVTIWSAVMNIVISIVLVQFVGLVGVIIGTLITDIYIWIVRTYQVVKGFFEESLVKYVLKMAKYCLITLLSVTVCIIVTKIIHFDRLWLDFIIKAIICVFISVLINFALTFRSAEFEVCKIQLIKYLKRRKA